MMTNANFSVQSTVEANFLNIQLSEPVRLDEIAVNVIAGDCPDFLIPFRLVNINDSITLKYKLINTIALEYANLQFNKKSFIDLYMSLLTPFVKGNDWFLNYHNFCIDPRYVYLDKMNGKVYFIYVPEYSYTNTDEEILAFFKNTFHKISITDDANFQVSLFKYFSRDDVTLVDLYHMFLEESKGNVSGIQEVPAQQVYVQQQEAPRVPQPEVKPQVTVSAPPVMEPEKTAAPVQETKSAGIGSIFGGGKKEKVETKSFVEEIKESGPVVAETDSNDEVMEALFGGGKKKGKEKPVKEKPAKASPFATQSAPAPEKKKAGFGLFGKKKEDAPVGVPSNGVASFGGANEMSAQNTVQTPQVQNNVAQPAVNLFAASMSAGDSDQTEISSDNVFAVSGAYLELIDSPIPGAMQRINLNFTTPFVTVGRISSDGVQPEIAFSKEFNRIGRRHARIEKNNGVYYVIDLGSANHTLLNGQILVPNTPYALTDGGELTFTDSKPVRYRIHLV